MINYGGHTKEALQVAINKYEDVHSSNDYDLVKAITSKILNRSNIKENFEKLKDEDDIYTFHFALLKAEWELLFKAKIFQESLPNNKQPMQTTIPTYNQVENKTSTENMQSKKKYKISELLDIYMEEKAIANKWSDKNIRDIYYVINHLISWTNDSFANDLVRNHFTDFRDNVIKNLPKKVTNRIFQNKNTKEILEITGKEKKEKLGLTAVNKHIGRVNQIFNWASNTGYIDKNFAADLRLKDTRKTKLSKKLKDTYEEEDLITLFEKSPWFATELNDTLRHNPENIFIPLLAIFNGGAKPTELAQLYTSDIKKYKGIWIIDFNNEDDKMLKDDYYNSRRVPIAQKILDIGFLDYVDYQKKQKSKQLFPQIVKYKGGGTNFTNNFSIYNREHITTDKKKSFYSIKHLVNQTFKDNKVDLYVINDVTGHSYGSDNKDIGTYGAGQMPENIMKETIDKCLTFDYIDLSKIKQAVKEIY
jgi:site-specific recombinase XerD